MDLGLLYGSFVMDDRELILHSTPGASSVYRDDMGSTHCAIMSVQNTDPDMERDPLSINQHLFDSEGIELFGTMLVAGQEDIYALVPDSTTSTADDVSPSDLQHVVGLSLGPAENLSACLPRQELHMSLCDNSLRPTLIADRRAYWTEVTPLLRKWKDVNDTACPHWHRIIRVNMSGHLRAAHTDNQCYWRCPVSTCPMWFSSELNGKDHLKRSFFDQREHTDQAMWMDLSLAHRSGPEQALYYYKQSGDGTSTTVLPGIGPVPYFCVRGSCCDTSTRRHTTFHLRPDASGYRGKHRGGIRPGRGSSVGNRHSGSREFVSAHQFCAQTAAGRGDTAAGRSRRTIVPWLYWSPASWWRHSAICP